MRKDDWLETVLRSELRPETKADLIDWYNSIQGETPPPKLGVVKEDEPERTGAAVDPDAFRAWLGDLHVSGREWSTVARRICRWLLARTSSTSWRAELQALLEDEALQDREFAVRKIEDMVRQTVV